MKRTLFLVIGLALSILVKAQNSATAIVTVSAIIIQPVGTVKIENASDGNSQPGEITIIDLKKLGCFHILNQGYVFDLYISEDGMLQEFKPGDLSRNIIIHFN